MVPIGLKDLFVPGSISFLILALIPGTLLLFRRKDAGRLGRLLVSAVVLVYWVLSTPIAAVALVDLLCPDVRPIMTKDDAGGAAGIVLLGAGMDVHWSHGEAFRVPTREGSLRVLEAARVHRVLGGAPIIASGGAGSGRASEAALMAEQLEQLGVPRDKIIAEEKSRNTREHAIFVPPLLAEHGIGQFVLVTSRQHIGRSMGVFRAAGLSPIPSTPEVFVGRGDLLEMYLPSRVALYASERMVYDLLGWVYYRARGWL